jgi:hypothetical protein
MPVRVVMSTTTRTGSSRVDRFGRQPLAFGAFTTILSRLKPLTTLSAGPMTVFFWISPDPLQPRHSTSPSPSLG